MTVPTNGTQSIYFENAPVVETVLSVQFNPLFNLRAGHYGRFWQQCLGEEWKTTAEAPLVKDQFERFDAEPLRIQLTADLKPVRVQFIHELDDRVVQLQPSRLMSNWRKRSESYPRFQDRLGEFRDLVLNFQHFVMEYEIGELNFNQWEVSYLNHIPPGELWSTQDEWHSVIPALVPQWPGFGNIRFERMSSEWHFQLVPQRGRLHVSIKSVLVEGKEMLALYLTARGSLDRDRGVDEIANGLTAGHNAVVSGFKEITSHQAHVHWRLKS